MNVKSVKVSKFIQLPLYLYGLLALVYLYNSKFSLFSWHTFFMTISYITLAGNAILIKKLGGYENTKTHGIIMTISSIFSVLGWYMIYTNKNRFNKRHLTSLHSKTGIFVLIAYISIGVAGFVFLHPDYGIMKSNKTIRFGHKIGGRVLTALAWITSVLGLVKVVSDPINQFLLTFPLIVLGYFILL